MTSQLKRNLISIIALGIFALLAAGSLPSTNKNSNTNSNVNSAPVASHASNTTTYRNSSETFTGTLQENYVDFTFDYPNSWTRDDKAGKGTSPNFVKVEKLSDDKVTIENFAVGYFTGQKELMGKLAAQLNEQLSGGFPDYKKVSEGNTRVGPYDGYEFRFTSHSSKTARGELDIWGRAVLLPGDTGRKGAVLLMLVTSASDDVHGVEEVGDKGELPVILNSFRFGK